MSIHGVILDVDGTLVDTNDAHARSWVEAFREQGIHVPYGTIRELVGKGGDKLMPEASGIEKSSPRGREIDRRRRELFEERELPHVQSFPGVRKLVQKLRQRSMDLVIASSSDEKLLSALLERTGASELLDERTSADEVENSKPEPDLVQVALEKLDLRPEEVVMVGDTPYDVASATSAGVAVIALRCGGWDDRALEGAAAIYDDPADLLARFETSPLASSPERASGRTT